MAATLAQIHPAAWWAWALGLALAAAQTPGAFTALALIGVMTLVVVTCRPPTPWARVFPAYLLLAASIVLIRVAFSVLVGVKEGGRVLVALPEIPLPAWAGGTQLLGPVTLGVVTAAASAGLGLGVLVVCFGAAISLTDPKRTMRALPASLYVLSTAAVIAVSLAPQLARSWQRIRRAQSLRGDRAPGMRSAVAVSVPVLEDALERTLTLAASMEARGYGHPGRHGDRSVSFAALSALACAAAGTYLILATDDVVPGASALGAAAVIAVAASHASSRRHRQTRYRPDVWTWRAAVIAGCGLAAPALAAAGGTLPRSDPAWAAAFAGCCLVAALPALVGAQR